jgi:hypothetical protein
MLETPGSAYREQERARSLPNAGRRADVLIMGNVPDAQEEH